MHLSTHRGLNRAAAGKRPSLLRLSGELLGLAAVLEVAGGALLPAGLYTRPVAFILSGEMAVAYFQVFAPKGFWPIVNGGIDPVLSCFIRLFFSAAGAGAWSLDAARKK